ncbi:MAG: helix-turn-helix transcriptional regulator [Clostridia bacterium]|nr:helix-turn-helix transcriptional regulator [Clostridia bacterium]
MDRRELTETIASNITALRQGAGMTQADLAEKLNYTDKAVSKWERAESLPDIAVIKEIADLFGVSVDALMGSSDGLSDAGSSAAASGKTGGGKKILGMSAARFDISLLSATAVWLVAVILYVVMRSVGGDAGKLWLIFVGAVPLTFTVLLVFNCIWGHNRLCQLIIMLLTASVLAFLYLLMLTVFGMNLWQIFLIAVPAAAALLLWYLLENRNRS